MQQIFTTLKRNQRAWLFVLAFAAIGMTVLITTHATTPAASLEAEDGSMSLNAKKLADGTASGGSAVKFTSSAGSSTPTAGSRITTADMAAARAMLTNEATHGWNDCDYASGGHTYAYHGVKVNWSSAGFNWNGEGHPDPDPCHQGVTADGRFDLTVPSGCWANPLPTNLDCQRHEDRLTTLRFLHALLQYKTAGGNPDLGGVDLDSEITKVGDHVLQLFQNPDQRGWSYFEFADIARLSGGVSSRFAQLAGDTLRGFETNPAPDTRPDWEIEQAAYLAAAAQSPYLTASEKTSFASDGNTRLNTYWAQNFVALKDSKGNPAGGAINTNGGSGGVRPIKTSEQADMANALADAGILDKAQQLAKALDLFRLPSGGYSQGADDIQNSQLVNIATKATAGRTMAIMRLNKTLANNSDVAALDTTFHSGIFMHGSNFPGTQNVPNGYEGVVYEQHDDFSLYTLTIKSDTYPQPANGQKITENWATSEAMGISMVALLTP